MLHSLDTAEWAPKAPSMPFGWMGQTMSVGASRGLKVEEVLLSSGIAAEHDRIVGETPLSPAEYILMCVLLINAVDDEMHGATRSRMRRGTSSLGIKLLGSGTHLGAAIVSLFRFFDLAGESCRAKLVQTERSAIVEIRADSDRSNVTTVVEEMMATYLHMLFSHYLGFYLPLEQFTTITETHPDLGRRHPYLGARVALGEVTQMVFPASYLALPPKTPRGEKEPLDAVLFWLSCFEPGTGGEPWTSRADGISRQVFVALLDDDLPFDACCALFGVSARSLRTGLFAEGTTYRRLRKIALVERVQPYLTRQSNTDDIAYGLGYSDARSLRRAVKSATGLTLGDIKQQGFRAMPVSTDAVMRNLRREMAQLA